MEDYDDDEILVVVQEEVRELNVVEVAVVAGEMVCVVAWYGHAASAR